MARPAEEHIPADVLAAAKRAGVEPPLWYVGRSNGHEGLSLDRSFDEVVEAARGHRNDGRILGARDPDPSSGSAP
jgi:hypothetical protein